MGLSAFEVVSILAISFLSFLLFLALFEPTLRYRVSHPPSDPLDSEMFCRVLAVLADSATHNATGIEVLTNGEVFYEALIEGLRRAKRSINLEAYIFAKGEVTRRMLEVMTEKARSGVKVNLVIDSIGSFSTWNSYFEEFCAAGGHVHWYHGFKWHQLPRLNSRTHREIVVIDCEEAFIGGPGFADHWLISDKGKPRWRDTMFHVRGDAVPAIQATFVENFLEASGELLTGSEYFCFPTVESNATALVVNSAASTGQSTRARMLFQTLMSAAQERLEITTPYFLPDRGVRKEMIRAMKERNVKIRIICPGEHSDHFITRHTSRRLYGSLLRHGAEIYEYQASMLHVKSMVVDGKWCVFGSTNLDHRSFSINDEMNLATTDPLVIARLREDFARDLQASRQITYGEWRKRSWFERGYEGLGRLLERQQ